MLDKINIENILFLDIETVPAYPNYSDMPDKLRQLWNKKAKKIKKQDEETPGELFPRAGIYAEFGRIICISVGFINNGNLRIKSFYGDDEKKLLQDFAKLLTDYFTAPNKYLCAHNGKEFDFPYIARRMLLDGIALPSILDLAGKKPWEVAHFDTMQLWRFGDYKSYTSLDLLTTIFEIPTPKDDIDGSQVGRVYYEENNLQRIVEYCQKDVVAIAQLFRRYQGKPLLSEDQVLYK